jgi:hypothetical protein
LKNMSRRTRFRTRSRHTPSPLRPVTSIQAESIVLEDTSRGRVSAAILARSKSGDASRDARLAHQFIERNAATLGKFSIDARVEFDGTDVFVAFQSGSQIGAFPLASPITGKLEIALVVRPRFGWTGLGRVLGTSGFKVIPQVLSLPLLPKTEREIPDWILSATILPRLKALLAQLARRFEVIEEVRSAPRGQVNWANYATQRVPAMKFLEVPCLHPDLCNDRQLTAAIHYVLRKQLSSLESQRDAGLIVMELLELCINLLRLVKDVSPARPSRKQLDGWFKTPFTTKIFSHGLDAITWSSEETGLGGTTDWRGLPWVMSMEEFYEAWVETLFSRYCRQFGGLLRIGRRRETITPIAWERPFLGSQKFLMPDLVIEHEDRRVFIDAKYKDHWEALQRHRWLDLEENVREKHRDDLLQVLAYSTLSESKVIVACLVYPCTLETWATLKERGTVSHRAAVYAGTRKIDLVMLAVPMTDQVGEIVEQLSFALAA